MGSCASVHKDPDSAMKYSLGLGSKAKRFFFPSPAKEKPLHEEEPVNGLGFNSPPDFGSKEEAFFESRAWLDSDCEDDFFSVNGEFTPSRGSTPIHCTSAPLTPKLENSIFLDRFPDSKSEPSPTGRKKLAELLQESLLGEHVVNAPDTAEETAKPDVYKADTDQPAKSVNGTPYSSGAVSVASSEVTPSNLKNRKDKAWKTGHCCLPSLHSFGFDERRQKMSPGPCTAQ